MLCLALLIMAPASAASVAVYGEPGGLNMSLHQDVFSVACSLPGSAGSELDAGQACFTNTSADVLIIYGDPGYSLATVANISNAVASGKILITGNGDLAKFSDILPVRSAGTANGSLTLSVTDPSAAVSADVFAGLPAEYPNTTLVFTRTAYAAKDGAVTLMSFDNGDPAVAYTRYGNGYVIAWLPPADDAYLTSTEADLIGERLVTRLLALRTITTAVPATTQTVTAATTPADTNAAAATTTPSVPAVTGESFGNVSVYSSPLGAYVYVDGVYKGIAPCNLTDISAGSHALKLALTDYYNYDTSITVIGGGTITAFGSLDPRASATAVVTTSVPTVTVTEASTIWSSPTVVAAIIALMTAVIGATVTLFTIYHKHK
ncbi:MAG: PEGA domain-containing protein [Methanoregula sp.]|jgi:hypothetical protein